MQKYITRFVQPYDAVKSWGAKVRVGVAVCVLAKASFQRLLSHTVLSSWLSSIHNVCQQEQNWRLSKRNRVQLLVLQQGPGQCCGPGRDGAETWKMLFM